MHALGLMIISVGALLCWHGWRGPWLTRHPCCRSCGYDLFALSMARKRCPECGSDIAKRGGVQYGLRSRRRAFLSVGALCILFGACAALIPNVVQMIPSLANDADKSTDLLLVQARFANRPAID